MANGAVPSEAGRRSADAERRARLQFSRLEILVDAVRPDDLLGRRHLLGGVRLGPVDGRTREDGLPEFAPADVEDASAPANLFFLWRQRDRLVGLAARDVAQLPRERIERELVAVLRVGDGFGALHDVQAEVEAVPPEDIAHVLAADDDHLQPSFLGDALQARRTHLTGRSDRETVAGDDEVLAAVHPRAKIRHQIAERPGLPALVERLEALGHAVGRGRDLIRIDGVEFLANFVPGRLLGSQKTSARPVISAAAAARRLSPRASTMPGPPGGCEP